MQNKSGVPKSNKQQLKSIFSCNVYRTNTKELRPTGASGLRNFKSSSTGKDTWPESQVLYVNEKALNRKPRSNVTKQYGSTVECGTQTSKTIVQLAADMAESGSLTPDSLSTTPREFNMSMDNCPYSVSNRLSELTLDGCCQERGCLFNCPGHHYVDRPLIQTYMENTHIDAECEECYHGDSKWGNSRSKSFVENYYHPNYIKEEPYTDPPSMQLSQTPSGPTPDRSKRSMRPSRKSSKTLELPDNSCVRRRSSSICYVPQNTFMSPTTASQNKSKKEDIDSVNFLIPPTTKGRSSSPKPSGDQRRFESSRKIPYIDQSKSDISSNTTLVNTTRHPEKAKVPIPELHVPNIDDLTLCRTSEEAVSVSSALDTNPSQIDNAICTATSKFREADWRIALRGLAEIVELCRVLDTDLIYDHMTEVNQRLIELLKSPRSHVCRTACQAAGHLFEYVKDTRRPEFDDIVDLLLFKTADANKFIRQDSNLALDCMVTHISTFNAVRALCTKGPFHKNLLVRSATARLLVCTVVIAGTDVVLNPNNNDYTRKRILVNMARFLDDKSLDTRKLGERLFKVLAKDPRFDHYLKKYVEKEQIAKIKKTLKIVQKK